MTDDGKLDWSCHGDLVARVLIDGTTKRNFLFEGDGFQLLFHGSQRGRQAGRAGSDNDDINRIGTALEFADGVDGLAALAGGFADQPHSSQFAGDKYPGYVGFKAWADLRNIHAAFLGAKNERDGTMRAGWQAGTVADAVGWVDQDGLATDESDGPFRAGCDTTSRTHAFDWVDYRV